jgi:hypothetical protein
MRWLPAAGLTLLVLCGAPWAAAQAQNMSPTMRAPLGYVQLSLVSGRLMLTPRQVVRTSNSSSSSGNDRSERITVDMRGPHPAIDYQLATSQFQLLITIRNQSQFRFVRELRAPTSKIIPFEFKQDEEGDLTFVWGGGDAQQTRRFPTLWHLLLVEGEAARTHLLPILEFFRPNWNLTGSTERIRDALFASVDQRHPIPRDQWAQLVSQLSDSRYARREAADRQLRAAGKAVLSYLDALPAESLDYEQRHRIRGIRRWLTRGDDNDAPESIAAWLGSDPRVWLALLNHADLARRQIAAKQLSLLLGEEITFDAAASLETRQQQIASLRPRTEPK